MDLYEKLQKAKSEEDVKKIYIDFLGLKKAHLGRIDIQTDEIWFEAKDKPTSTYQMFTQLLHYVNKAKKEGESIPPFLCVIDKVKAAIMETKKADPILQDKNIKWGLKASQIDHEILEKVSQYIGTNFVEYTMEHFSLQFKEAVQIAIKEKRIVRKPIKPSNLIDSFNKWVEKIGKEIFYESTQAPVEEKFYTPLFYADIMSDGTNPIYDNLPTYIIHAKGNPAFNMNGQTLFLKSLTGYREFWTIYEKPPKQEFRETLLERQDTLIPLKERKLTGAYYTPLIMVSRAYEELTQTLGDNWQNEYIVWDMCCGVGNLESIHNQPRQIFMSTLEGEHIDIMKASKTCLGARFFQYDYLNDDIDPNTGQIDYSLTQKMPTELQKILKDGKQKMLVLINPPYGEAGSGNARGEDNKPNIANTQMRKWMPECSTSRGELFIQFAARILKEIPQCTLAMFSTLKYVNAPSFQDFRQHFKARFLSGFMVHSQIFDGLKGNFPIGFCIWQIDHQTPFKEITLKIVDKKNQEQGEKTFFPHTEGDFLNGWVKRPPANQEEVIPLKNAMTPYTGQNPLKKWADEALGYMCLNTSDMQHAGQNTFLLSSPYGGGHGMYINADNLEKAAIMFTVRRVVKFVWYKDRDQFLIPHTPYTNEFAHDCLIWMLFNGSNLTASANGLEYGGKHWNLVNHFIPYTEVQVNAPERFESDFLVRYLSQRPLSSEAQAVYQEGLLLWQQYFRESFNYKIREELKLNRPDVGWYQVRKALEMNVNGGADFSTFKEKYASLTEKILPKVYEYGFLI